MGFDIRWHDAKREPTQQPDPRYPDGIDLDLAGPLQPACSTLLPYPAKRCGAFLIRCTTCGWTGVVSTAGRPDDPRSVRIPCKAKLQ